MHPAIAQHRTGIATICQRLHVSRLEVFGSAARADDVNPATSDVDFLIEFADSAKPASLFWCPNGAGAFAGYLMEWPNPSLAWGKAYTKQ